MWRQRNSTFNCEGEKQQDGWQRKTKVEQLEKKKKGEQLEEKKEYSYFRFSCNTVVHLFICLFSVFPFLPLLLLPPLCLSLLLNMLLPHLQRVLVNPYQTHFMLELPQSCHLPCLSFDLVEQQLLFLFGHLHSCIGGS